MNTKNKKNQSIPGNDIGLFSKYHRWFLLGIALLTALLYSNSLRNGFTGFDDMDYIINNPYLKDLSFGGIKNIFSSFYAANYHPLTTLLWAVEYNIFKDTPLAYHVFNLLFHLMNIFLVFYFVKYLLQKNTSALIVAFLFAVHPMHVESVSWISEFKDVLYTFFFLSSLIFYLKYIRNNFSLKFLLAAFLMFLLSLFAKSAAVTLPVIFFVIDYYLKRRFNRKNILEKMPFFALSMIFGILAIVSQQEAMHSVITPVFPYIDRIFLASYAVAYYFLMMFFPFHFSVLHFYPAATEGMLPLPYYFSILVIAAIVLLLIKARKHRSILIMGFGFFLAGISLVVQLIPFGQAIVAERYTYVPYIGLFMIIAEAGMNLTSVYKKIFLLLMTCLALFYCVSTYQRNFVWKDSMSLFKDVYQKYPDSYYSSYALGNAFKEKGDVDDAIKFYSRSIELNADFGDNYNNRGVLKNQMKDYAGAISDLTIALKYPTATTYTYFNRGVAYFNSLEFYKAICDFDAAIKIKNDFSEALLYRADAKGSLKKFKEALVDYDQVIQLDPKNGMAYANRATTKYFLDDKDGACLDWQSAVDMGFADAAEKLKYFCEKK